MKININKNDFLISVIVTVVIILIIILVILLGISRNTVNEVKKSEEQIDYYNEYQQTRATEGITADDATATLVDNANNYYTVKSILDKFNRYILYLNASVSDLGLIVSKQEESSALEEYKQDGIKNIYDMLSNNYKIKYEVDDSYIYNNLKDFSGKKYQINKMYVVEDSSYINTYFIYGKYEDMDYNFIVILDRYNYTFEIYLSNYLRDNNYVFDNISSMKTLHIEKVEKNENNTFQFKNINQQELANTYYKDFLTKMKSYPELAYSVIEPKYREERMNNITEFNNYIIDYTSRDRFLKQYKMSKYDTYTELVCQDSCGIIWIFKINGVMDYTIVLDSYTIPIESYNDEYQNADDSKKSQLCLNKFLEAINNKDYERAYNFLNNTYKEENFKNLNEFKTYIQNNWFSFNTFSYYDVKSDEKNYILSGTLSDTTRTGYNEKYISKTFIVKLGNGITDFEMSFEK